MVLSDRQIDRYSRQIIVPRLGARAQERLLGSHIVLAGCSSDIEPALAYLVGAGVGKIDLDIIDAQPDTDALIAEMRALNADVEVSGARRDRRRHDLAFVIAGSERAASAARAFADDSSIAAIVIARLDSPARIGIYPARSPCPRCAPAAGILSEFGARASIAPIVAMASTVESLKLLAGYGENPRAGLVEFDGYDSHLREIARDPECACAARR